MRKAKQPHGGEIHLLEPGETANRNGRPPKIVSKMVADLKAQGFEPVTAFRIREAFEQLIGLNEDTLKAIKTGKDNPILMRLCAGELLQASSGGSERILNFLLDRAHGKATQRNEITGEDGQPFMPMANVTFQILGAGETPVTSEDELPDE